MPTELKPKRRHPVLKAAIIGGLLGFLLALALPHGTLSLGAPERVPLPHQLPKYPGGIALRFSMVHDVLHERFPKHGPAYYTHRNALVTAQLAKLGGLGSAQTAADPHWRLSDDLTVGHVHLGQFDLAIAAARAKLARQEALEIAAQDLYPTYANLGTAMMIQAIVRLSASTADDAAKATAKSELTESLVWVKNRSRSTPRPTSAARSGKSFSVSTSSPPWTTPSSSRHTTWSATSSTRAPRSTSPPGDFRSASGATFATCSKARTPP
ncbi:MAG TPA: hypothetical protein VEA69_08385 [Tepidisphaeraceae bacterium]|nr:hypothetical protein [Tepidisphaeraceae bacterium]